jgi:hypothetical protein
MDQATERVLRLNELYQVRRPARLYSSTCHCPTCTRDIQDGWSELAARNLAVDPYRNELLPQCVRMMIGSLGLPPQDLKASHPTGQIVCAWVFSMLGKLFILRVSSCECKSVLMKKAVEHTELHVWRQL